MNPETPDPTPQVALRELTPEDVVTICRLSDTLSPAHRRMVADNAISIAQGHCAGADAWMRAIYAGDQPVGFVMLDLEEEPEDDDPGPFLWRLMIAGPEQGKGYGRAALRQVFAWAKARGARHLATSCGQSEGSPEGFYRRLGFEPTGDWIDDEKVLRLQL